jgi:hypothetical protein
MNKDEPKGAKKGLKPPRYPADTPGMRGLCFLGPEICVLAFCKLLYCKWLKIKPLYLRKPGLAVKGVLG